MLRAEDGRYALFPGRSEGSLEHLRDSAVLLWDYKFPFPQGIVPRPNVRDFTALPSAP